MPYYSVGKGITRIEPEEGGSFGSMVRIRRKGVQINEFYSDKKHGGKRKTRAIAEARYAELLNKLGPYDDRLTRNTPTHRNTTGYVGVHLAKSIDVRWSGNEYLSYCASWVDEEGMRKKIAFSFRIHGEKAALELAVLARKKRLNDRAKVLALYQRQSKAKKKSPKKK